MANGGLAGNAGFDGVSNANLLSGLADLAGGASATISFVVRVTTNGAPGPFLASSNAAASTLDGGAVTTTDLSDNGTVVDADNDGNPNEAGENDPSPVILGGTTSGLVFLDSNGNGAQDAGEAGIGGVPVAVTSGGFTQTVTTDGNGNFVATNVPPGNATVAPTTPPGFVVTTDNSPHTGRRRRGGQRGRPAHGTGAVCECEWRGVARPGQRSPPGRRRARDAGLDRRACRAGHGHRRRDEHDRLAGSVQLADVVPATLYRIRYVSPSGIVFGVGVNGESGNAQPGSSLNAAARSLEVTPLPGTALVQQSLPVDPQGIVYDTLTRQALAGAVLSLTGPAGFDPVAQLLGGAINAQQTTGADGAYQFLLLPSAPSGRYTLAITAPPGYTAPSSFLPPSGTLDPTGQGAGGVLRVQGQGMPPSGAQPTTYYLEFDLAPADPDIVNNHVPIDPAGLNGGAVRLIKRVDRVSASAGGIVAYTITIENTTNSRLPDSRSATCRRRDSPSSTAARDWMAQPRASRYVDRVRWCSPASTSMPGNAGRCGTCCASARASYAATMRTRPRPSCWARRSVTPVARRSRSSRIPYSTRRA